MIVSVESEFLNGKFCKENQIRQITILNEGLNVSSEDFKTKKEIIKFQLETELPDKTKRKWQPNKTALKSIINVFGAESKNWVGKKVKLFLEPYESSYTIKVDEDETEVLNGIKKVPAGSGKLS